MSEEEKEAIKELKHYISITPHWKLKEYTFSEVDYHIKTTLNYIQKLKRQLKGEIYARDMVVSLNTNLKQENEELKEKIREYEIGMLKE